MAFCTECGKEIQNDSKFCPFCGAKLNNFIPVEELSAQSDEAVENPVTTQNDIQTEDAVIYVGETVSNTDKNSTQADDSTVATGEASAEQNEYTSTAVEAVQAVETEQQNNVIEEFVEEKPGNESSAENLSANTADIKAECALNEVNGTVAGQLPVQPQQSAIAEPSVTQTAMPVYSTGAADNGFNTGNGGNEKRSFTFFCVQDNCESFDKADINENKVLSAFSYLPPLFFLPLVCKKESRFARFHANQSLLLTITAAVWSILNIILSVIIKANFHTATYWGYTQLSTFGAILTALVWSVEIIGVVTLFYLGLIDTMNGRAKKLPIIGSFNLLYK